MIDAGAVVFTLERRRNIPTPFDAMQSAILQCERVKEQESTEDTYSPPPFVSAEEEEEEIEQRVMLHDVIVKEEGPESNAYTPPPHPVAVQAVNDELESVTLVVLDRAKCIPPSVEVQSWKMQQSQLIILELLD